MLAKYIDAKYERITVVKSPYQIPLTLLFENLRVGIILGDNWRNDFFTSVADQRLLCKEFGLSLNILATFLPYRAVTMIQH